MIEFRMRNSDQLWSGLGAIVHKEDLPVLVQFWISNGYEFRIDDTVYQEFNDEFEKMLAWEYLKRNTHHD